MNVEAPPRRQRRRSGSRSRRPSPKRRAEATPSGRARPYVRPDRILLCLLHGDLKREFIPIPDGIELITFAHAGQNIAFNHAKTIFDGIREHADLFMHGTINALQEMRIPHIDGDSGVLRIYKSGERCRDQRLQFKLQEPYLGFYAPDKAEFNYTQGPDVRARASTASLERITRQLASLSLADRPRETVEFTHGVRNWPVRGENGELTSFYLTTKGHETEFTNTLIRGILQNDIVGHYMTLEVLLQSLKLSMDRAGLQKMRLFLVACMEITAADIDAINQEIIAD